MKHKTTLALFIIVLFISCGPHGQKIQYEGEVDTIAGKNNSINTNFKLGQDIKLGDFVVKVNKVTDYKCDNEISAPKEGNKLIAIEVEYYNPTTDKQINVNCWDWKVIDNENYSYDTGFLEPKEPYINTGTINPGGKLKGWITFEIPKTSIPKKVQFKPDLIDNANIEIAL